MNLRKAKFRVGIEQINRGWRSPKLVQGLDSLRIVSLGQHPLEDFNG